MYVVTGATGHTGQVVAENLLANGEKVRVIGRDAKRLEPLVKKGAEPFAADMTDATALIKAFSGATAVYAMVPPNLAAPSVRGYQEQVSGAITAAIEKNEVKHAVVLSSIGADKAQGTGPVVGLRHLEEKLNRIAALNALYVRAGYFMENFLSQVSVLQALGSLAGPVRPDLPLPLIATRDISAYVAQALVKRDFQGKRTRELLGARDASYEACASVIGAAIGKPGLRYMQVSGPQLKPILMQMGMSESMSDGLLEMSDALNSGHMKALEPRSAANTTPTTFETFVTEYFVPAYGGQSVGA